MSGSKTAPLKEPADTGGNNGARQNSEEMTVRYILSISSSLAAIALLAIAYAYV